MSQPTKCLMVDCPWSATIGGLCAPCHHWAVVVLADARYRTEKPPAPPFAVQATT